MLLEQMITTFLKNVVNLEVFITFNACYGKNTYSKNFAQEINCRMWERKMKRQNNSNKIT